MKARQIIEAWEKGFPDMSDEEWKTLGDLGTATRWEVREKEKAVQRMLQLASDHGPDTATQLKQLRSMMDVADRAGYDKVALQGAIDIVAAELKQEQRRQYRGPKH